MRVGGEIEFCDCGRMKPIRKDVGICEPCYAVAQYKRQREAEYQRRIGDSSSSVSS